MTTPRDDRGVQPPVASWPAPSRRWAGRRSIRPRPRPRNAAARAPVAARERIRITRLETLLVKPRWLFLKVHTDAGIVGLGEPIVEGRRRDGRRPRSRRSSPT